VLSGPPFPHLADSPATLASLLRSRTEHNLNSRFLEIDLTGRRTAKTTAELHELALQVLKKLERSSADGSDVVLCFESVLDFIPAAWACVYRGYTWLPWHMSRLPSKKVIVSRLQLFSEKLHQPLLVTTHSNRIRLASLKPWPFRAVLSIDKDEENLSTITGPGPRMQPADKGRVLMLTSGTTGKPKIATIRHECFLNRLLAKEGRVLGGARLLFDAFDSVGGLGNILPNSDGSVFLQPERAVAKPCDYLSAIEEFRIRSIGISSSFANRILEAAQGESEPDLSCLEHVAFGAEMIVPRIAIELGTKLEQMGATNLKVSFVYGMTETGTLCRKPNMTLQQIRDSSNDGVASVGGCTPGYSIRIVDEAGILQPPGLIGNIEVRSREKLFSGYFNEPEFTQESFTADGWFKTGDVGFAEGEALRLTGRQKSTIIINARKFSLEAIEASIHQTGGIYRSLVVAAPVRFDRSPTDELAVFFVPSEDVQLDELCRQISRAVGQHGVSVKHFVPLKEADFPLTATGKIRRDELVQLYQSGQWTRSSLSRAEPDAELTLTEAERRSWLMDLWKGILKLDFSPGLEDDFFDLGGDSLASAEVIIAVEEKFSCQIQVDAFFQSPMIATLDGLIDQGSAIGQIFSRPDSQGAEQLLHKLQILTTDWKGKRLFPEGLVIGLNEAGTRAPIFWVFQESFEFAQLAKHLGPDQPIYGMRSCVGIVRPREYSTVIDPVCSRYFLEIMALAERKPFVVGGNCQGAILSLELARRLNRIGRYPSLLVLAEWSYYFGRYADPTLLLYGEQSYTADIYQRKKHSKINWQEDFPQSTVMPIPGRYGELFTDENIGGFVQVLRKHISPTTKPRSLWSRLKVGLRNTDRTLNR
jgi:acyl-CoA synthetase (AMP-forming)/AMP-acid ligase II/acyl carrier protein